MRPMAEIQDPYTSCWVAMTMDNARFFDTEDEARAAGMDHVGRVRRFFDDAWRMAKHLLRTIDWQLAEENYCDEIDCRFDRVVMPEPDPKDQEDLERTVLPQLQMWLRSRMVLTDRMSDWYFVSPEDWEEKTS